MRIASYNIRKSVGLDYKRDPLRILDVLNEIDADVVFLQEVDRRTGDRESTLLPELLESYCDYKPVDIAVREHSLGWHGNVILIRKEATCHSAWRIELPTLEPRGAIAAEISIAGLKLRCVAAHLGLLARIRKAQVRRIVSALRLEPTGLPTIIAGDFNEWRRAHSCIDMFGSDFRPLMPRPSFPSALPIVPLDRIIISSDITVSEVASHRSKKAAIASDHLPIWAELELPGLLS